MAKFAFILAVVLLVSAAFALNYTQSYVIDGWLSVTRTVSVAEGSGCPSVTDACSDTGAVFPPSIGGAGRTYVQLAARNVGPSDRSGVQLTESLIHVPTGASLSYTLQPSSTDGRTATWNLGQLERGEGRLIEYDFDATIEEGDVLRIPAVSGSSASASASLSVPRVVKVGERVGLIAKAAGGQPLAGARITVSYPDGTSQRVGTDSQGSAVFTATKEGFYTYSIEGYSLSSLSSTEAEGEVPPTAGGAVPPGDLISGFASLLPFLAAIFVIAVVALIAYNFFTSRKEEEEYETAPGKPEPTLPQPPKRDYGPSGPPVVAGAGGMVGAAEKGSTSGATYSQQYSFGAPKPPLEQQKGTGSADEMDTRKLVQSRVNEGFASQGREEASSDEEVERELAQLERQAREEGESASEEQEIEKAIAELEAIRQKLRERKEQMDELSRSMGPETPDEVTIEEEEETTLEETEEPLEAVRKSPSRKAVYRKPAPKARVLPPKKRIKLGSRGMRRK